MTTETEKPPTEGISRRTLLKGGLAFVAGGGFLDLLGNTVVAMVNSEKLPKELREKAERCENLRCEASQAYVEGDIPRAQTIFKSSPYQDACFQKDIASPAQSEIAIKNSEEKTREQPFFSAEHPWETFVGTSVALMTLLGLERHDNIRQKPSTDSPPTPHP